MVYDANCREMNLSVPGSEGVGRRLSQLFDTRIDDSDRGTPKRIYPLSDVDTLHRAPRVQPVESRDCRVMTPLPHIVRTMCGREQTIDRHTR